jgi:hypothetical protein
MMEIQGSSNIARWRDQPQVMVRELFGVEPDPWQDDALIAFPKSPRLAMKACKGPGKTAVLAWIGWNFLLTRPHPMCGATSTSGANLKANLWTELARWRNKSELLQATFELTKSTIFAKDHPETWKMEARTWAKDADASQIGTALAGIHAEYVLWLADESGDYPDSILPTLEGIFAGEPKEAHVVQAGNPLMLSGPLYHACTTARRLWKVVEITADPDDPKRSSRISVEHARQQIEQWGADSPWVLVNIFGKFPPSSINALIGPEAVREAMQRSYKENDIRSAPRILSVDVARFGDDKSVINKRQGLQMFKPMMYRNIDSTQGAGAVSREWTEWGADACFIDMTGGWGSGWFDQLVLLGKAPIGIQYAGEAHNKTRYFNKRCEMAFDLVEWIKRGGALYESDELLAALTNTTYTFKGDRFLLEPKEDVKVKLGYSPDEFDAAMGSFAQPITPASRVRRQPPPVDYNPFGELDRVVRGSYAQQDYDPYRNT